MNARGRRPLRETTRDDIPDYSHLNYEPEGARFVLFATVGWRIHPNAGRPRTRKPQVVFSMFDYAYRQEVRRWPAMSLRQAEHERQEIKEYVQMRNDLDDYHVHMDELQRAREGESVGDTGHPHAD